MSYMAETGICRIGTDFVLVYTAWVIFNLVRDGAEHGSIVPDIVEWIRSWATWVWAEVTIAVCVGLPATTCLAVSLVFFDR
jgi:phage-related minor tail protein